MKWIKLDKAPDDFKHLNGLIFLVEFDIDCHYHYVDLPDFGRCLSYRLYSRPYSESEWFE